ncbi:hypothetical protein BOX37_30750 [Nocardia mangyaensis]|uniref:Uncharacterized protein n=1 Tax=Nocardia mangyaensis TaxID=2213200 RepID=A0A1J0VZR2_9NOCA|nr:hypothetical protein [Nocardia mangyaensis]APE37584.1 hypothetical protein BOX37_30750 [Nocardia mangyaensis]
MATLLTLAVALAFGLAVHHFAPKASEPRCWPFPSSPHDRAFGTYDDQRLHRDLAAIRARETEPDSVGADNSVQLSETGPVDTEKCGPLAA